MAMIGAPASRGAVVSATRLGAHWVAAPDAAGATSGAVSATATATVAFVTLRLRIVPMDRAVMNRFATFILLPSGGARADLCQVRTPTQKNGIDGRWFPRLTPQL